MDSKIFANKKVLIVEDDYANQKVAALFLKKLGCQTIIASNGIEAVEKALSETFDLVLMDCQMPVMDGIEATIKIRQQLPEKPPIIAMTANIDYKDKQNCFDAGMNDFVSKPIKLSSFKNTLMNWLEK